MSNFKNLDQFVDQALEEVINGSSAITKKELKNGNGRYELKLAEDGGKNQPKLILKKKGNGRPVPVVIVNAISEEGENLLYRDQRIDYSDKVLRDIIEALEAMVESLQLG